MCPIFRATCIAQFLHLTHFAGERNSPTKCVKWRKLGLLHRKTKHTLYRTIIERETISAMTTVFAFKIASYFVMGLMLMTLVVNRESL